MTRYTVRNATVLVLSLLAITPCATASSGSQANGFDPDQPTVLITGSNRGIGFALTRYYAGAGWNVIATARNPAKADELNALAAGDATVVVEQLDVTDLERIDELARIYSGIPIDVLINNAAVLGDLPGQAYGTLDYEQFQWTMAVNIFGPMAMAEAFESNVAASEQKKILTLTSGLGSLTLMSKMQGMIYYRISKAGVNMGMRAIRANLIQDGIIVALIAPGMVQTQLLADSGYTGKALTPGQSAAGMAEIIDGLTLDDIGKPTNVDGRTIPW
ncbi:MAG: SDR family oxidoreductase [Gammaproteobacteria bacterium]|nr:SDR family oxidoreductase [Gammaproteobacteria bacterium]MDP7271671.1 SDR family oxidoreductase [Gammaproteobacteria bacterium]MDP7660654.1 SDR family oxidoreductase [Gammaproteobacteria bacterium]HJP03474.1 SDR family oxidoreductase [Gammaproteobacteria bacterium]